MQYFPLPKVMNYDSILSVRFSCLGLHGQAVKTSPFHGGNTGSIPVGVIDAHLMYNCILFSKAQ